MIDFKAAVASLTFAREAFKYALDQKVDEKVKEKIGEALGGGACQASCRLIMPLLWFYSLPPTPLR